MVLVAATGCEITSALVYWAVTGRAYRQTDVAALRAEAKAPSDATLGPRAAIPLPQHLQEIVLHPFIGFVGDPQRDRGFSDFGFWGSRTEPLPAKRPNRVVVAVLGGSVAAEFVEKAAHHLTARLRTGANQPEVHVFMGACGGYKQPQGLAALTWLLALGAQFDIVVNLDGFNDVALDGVENAPAGVFYGYPRAWAQLTSSVADLPRLRAAARLLARRELRGVIADTFDRPILRSSVSASVVWVLLDRHIERTIAGVAALVASSPEKGRYVSSGPPERFASTDERFDALVSLWARSSLLTDRLCRGMGARYFHFLQPNQYVPGSKPLSRVERTVAYDAASPYRAGVELGYPRLRKKGEELRAQGVAFSDLSDLFRDTPDPVYVDTCCHLSDAGYRRLAEAIAEAIVRRDAAFLRTRFPSSPGLRARALDGSADPRPGPSGKRVAAGVD